MKRNQLTELKFDTFYELQKLKDLNLAHNSISVIDSKTFINNKEIENLILASNQIEKIHENTFKNMKKLIYLSLNNNKIIELGEATFKVNLNLIAVDLTNNKLKYIPESIFDIPSGKLGKVLLSGNDSCINDDEKFIDSNTKLTNLILIRDDLVEYCLPINIKECTTTLEAVEKEKESINISAVLKIEEIQQNHRNKLENLKNTLELKVLKLESELEFESKKSLEAGKQFQKYRNLTEFCEKAFDDTTKEKDTAMRKLIECEIKYKQDKNKEFDDMKRKNDDLLSEIAMLKEKALYFDFPCQVKKQILVLLRVLWLHLMR